MKRKIAFLLSAVMILTSMLGILSFADGTDVTESTTTPDRPEITYANVNYAEGLVLMFAVPVPENLPEDAKLSLLLWSDPLSISTGGYRDATATFATEILHGGTTTVIGDVQHYVFKYEELSANMMTDVVYVRPIISLSDGTRIYGEMINYSVVEYAMGAMGEIEGISPLSDPDVIALIDTMLDFGSMAQAYICEDGEYHLPNGYYAGDELSKIMIVPSYDGKNGDAVLGGFFKKGEATYATLNPIYDDYYTVVGWYNADGEELVDEDDNDDNGVQIAVNSESDITVTLKLARKSLLSTNVNEYENFKHSSLDLNKNNTIKNTGDFSFNPSYTYTGHPSAASGYQKDNAYHSLQLMDDPYNPGEKVYKWTASTLSAIYFSPTSGATLPMSSGISGFGDTVDTAITIEIEVGRNENGEVMKTGIFRIRSDYDGKQVNFAVFAIGSNGEVVLAKNNEALVKNGVVIGTIPETGYGRFAFTVDFNDGTMKGYYENENGEMVLGGESVLHNPTYEANFQAGVEGYTSFRDWAINAQKKFEWFGDKNALTAEELKELADVDGDGVEDTPIKVDGVVNPQALAYVTEKHNSLLIKSVGIYAGIMYE